MPEVASAANAATDLARTWPAWPVYGLSDDLLPALERWAAGGHRVAIATLVHIVGSSPRPLGSEMAICDTGEVTGYVSGGCVEGAVAAEALAVMREGKPHLLDYGAGSPILDVQLACGGRIGILVRELVDPADYATRLRNARKRRIPLAVHIDLETGAQTYHAADAASPTPEYVTHSDASLFAQVYLPPVRLLIVGSNPVVLALARLAAPLGYEVTLLRAYGPAEPPPDVPLARYDRRALEAAIGDAQLDAWTAVYTLTHHADDDFTVLQHALPSPAFCVGVLGSRGKIQQRLARLGAAGIDAAARARLQAPAGLPIDARGPQEIALAILAQIVSKQPKPASHLLTARAGLFPDSLGATASACAVAG